ncbi:MAG: MBL fold metallo-hydrolase [bacterium]|nr:MBL fold metallo-hydrolase [bacterium]
MEQQKSAITFCSGVGTVTGANFLFEIASKRILIDCGLEQGSELASERNRETFAYDPSTIDILFITHAHTDHIGRIPKLVKDGFKGIIYSTPATLDLAKVMLPDSLHLLGDDARRKGILPLYEQIDVDTTFNLWKTFPYYERLDLGNGISVYAKDSGHILGSAMFEFSLEGSHKKVVFTGDLGNSPSLFLRDTDSIEGASYVVMESVYGDRNHELKEERKSKLADIIKDTIARKRTLLIPVFSLERTQDILFEINDLVERNVIGDIKVYVDSPLATKVTEVYKQYSKDFNESARDLVAQGDDIFEFKLLRHTIERKDSEHIEHTENPKIILAGSGMSVGGRILKHEEQFLPDPSATILFVGYQSAGTLGRRILDGDKKVKLQGNNVPVRCEVQSIMGYSSHKDSDRLVEFVATGGSSLKKVFVAMGEPKSALFLVQRIRDYIGVDALHPKQGQRVELEM